MVSLRLTTNTLFSLAISNRLSILSAQALFLELSLGNKDAFTEIYDRYYSRIYQLAFMYSRISALAEDASQQIFLSVWERRHELQQVDNPEGWLFRAARFQVWRMMQKESGSQAYRDHILALLSSTSMQSPYDSLVHKQYAEQLVRLIDSLPPKQQEVYRMAREEGLTYTEIAGRLGIGRETVKEHMAKALKRIRDFFLAPAITLLISTQVAELFF